MGTAAVKIKIMPESPDSNLNEIQAKAQEIINKNKAMNLSFETQPIAFGLNAIIATFAWDEDISTNDLEEQLRTISHVNSAEIIDFRRSFG